MSGLDPLASLSAKAALTSAQVQAIDLGVAVEILEQQLTVGDLLTATVLPAQGGTDLLSLFGTTVVAQLPTGVNPGQSLLLQVTGFTNNQILVQNLGVIDPENPPETVTVTLPDPDAPPPQQAVVTSYAPAPPASPNAPPATASASSSITPLAAPNSPGGLAPPVAVFVAASVRPSANVPPAAPPLPEGDAQAPAPPAPAPSAPQAATTAPAAGASPSAVPASLRSAPPEVPIVAEPEIAAAIAEELTAGEVAQLGVEARIAATHAASIDIANLVRQSAPPRAAAQPLSGQVARTPLPAARTPVPTAPPLVSARPQPGSPAPVPASARPLVPPSPESALLARLRVPISPVALAAAKIAGSAATALPRALAKLDALLAGVSQQDGRAATLRSLLNFAGKLDPGNARALPEQLEAFVNNFVGGSESKIATMIRALLEAESPAPAALNESALAAADSPAAQPSFASPSSLAQATPAPATPPAAADAPAPETPAAPAPAVDAAVAARVAERTVALQYDAKASVAALIETPPRGAAPELAAALNETLTAITGLQLNVLSAQNANPNAITIPFPAFYREQGAPVQVRIARDPAKGGRFDADNFSIAFVLDTQTLGTVAIDVQTVGRSLSVNVKTEGAPAASRFSSTLDELRGRLKQLRYTVASMTAGVAPHRFGAAPEPEPGGEPAPPERVSSILDMQA